MQRLHQPHWGARGWAIVVFSVLCVLIALGAVLASVLQGDQGPLEPTPAPTESATATASIGPATPATPGIQFDPDPAPRPGSLPDLLAYAPDRLADDSLPLSDIAQYADIEQWMALQGITPPDDGDAAALAEWQASLDALAIPEVVSTRGVEPMWRDTYGFGLQDVDQVLAVGSAPDFVLIFRGDFDTNALHAAWAESGYQAVRVEGMTVWSLYPGDSVDLSAPASRPALGNLNNIVLMEDGTLIATSRLSRLEQTVRVVHHQEPALSQNPDVRRILSPGAEPERLITATLMRGSVLESGIPAEVVATPVTQSATPGAEEPLPQADLLLMGLIPAGQDNDLRMVILVSYPDAQSATRAHMRAQQEILTGVSAYSGDPYIRLLGIGTIRVLATTDEESLLLMHLRLNGSPADWRDIVEHRDLGFIMWPREPE